VWSWSQEATQLEDGLVVDEQKRRINLVGSNIVGGEKT